MKKRIAFIFLITLVSVLFFSCSKTEKPESVADSTENVLKVVLLLNGTLGDKSFFDSAHKGMEMIAARFGSDVETKTIEMGVDKTKWEPTLLDISEADWDVIICGTWEMVERLQDVAPDYPEKKYIIFDSGVDYSLGNLGHVYSIGYKQNEGSFIAGALAAKMTTSDLPLANDENLIGFLGGMDIPVINDFMVGYVEGAQYVDPNVKVAISYIGSFDDSAKGKELALSQFSQGVDIGFNVAGLAGLGQLDAAKEMNRYAIGVDSDQAELFMDTDKEKAEIIATSVLKRVDESLLRAIELHRENKLPYGEMEVLGFSENCVGIAENSIYDGLISEDIRDFLEQVKMDIVSGKINVSSAFGLSTEELTSLKNSVKP